jgi:hypothetical protein
LLGIVEDQRSGAFARAVFIFAYRAIKAVEAIGLGGRSIAVVRYYVANAPIPL